MCRVGNLHNLQKHGKVLPPWLHTVFHRRESEHLAAAHVHFPLPIPTEVSALATAGLSERPVWSTVVETETAEARLLDLRLSDLSHNVTLRARQGFCALDS